MSWITRGWAPIAILLSAAAAVHLGYQWCIVGLDPHDAGQYETVLAAATAGQLRHGFGAIYGPYTGENPSVLMHAPSYYRLVALGALLPARYGFDPLDASLGAGRVITWLATVVLLAMTWRLSGIGGARWQAGLFASALVAASPILGVLAIMLRPDTFGVALATGGLVLFLRFLLAEPSRRSVAPLFVAYGLFALAVCVKQQNAVVPLVASLLLLASAARGRVKWTLLLAVFGVAAALGGTIFALEDSGTAGLFRRTVFELPGGAFREINYGGWEHVRTIALDCLKRSAGLLLLGALAVGVLGRRALDQPLDRLLAMFLAAEVLALVPFCLFNKGAADNYALQAVVLASVLCGRLVDRALVGASWSFVVRAAFPLACLLLLMNDLRLIHHVESCRRAESSSVASLLGNPHVEDLPADQRYFAGDQEFNRLYGRRALIHDEWLYGAFESIGEAEPRSRWLRDELQQGLVRQLVLAHEPPGVPGIDQPLTELGFERIASEGRYSVWVR